MEILQIISQDILQLISYIGRVLLVFLVILGVIDVIGGVVSWIGNEIDTHRKIGSIRK